ncbi:MAG: sodium-dependent transporter [Thermoplasmatota archaeon]
MAREQWRSRMAFVMAAIGSAVGLGNIWRFPYVCYQNGGGAFLIPYFVALFTVGIPLLMVEFAVGKWFGSAAPRSFARIHRKWEWAGWWAVLAAFVIAVYYSVIMAWCLSYIVHSSGLIWGGNAAAFFDQFLGKTAGPFAAGGLNMQIVFALLFIWTAIYLILYKGVRSIEWAIAFTVPVPTLLLVVLAVRGVTLPGAMDGLSFYLTPHFAELASPSVWLAAYAQIFFSLSLAQGIMIAYASYLQKDSDVTNNACIAALADGGIAFLAGFAVFSVLGYLAHSTGVAISEAAGSGLGLAFITYPTAISELPVAAALFGAIFFLVLLTFGINSAFSMIESVRASVTEKGFSRHRATIVICLLGFLLSVPLASGAGIYWVEIADHFISNFGLVLIGLAECIVFGYVMGARHIRRAVNEVSDFTVGRWWEHLVRIVAPVILIFIALASFIELLAEGHAGLPAAALAVGFFIVIATVIGARAFARIRRI